MKKEERDLKLQEALESYILKNISLKQLSEELGIAVSTISLYLKKNKINVKYCEINREPKLQIAIKELQFKSIKQVSEEYGIDEKALILANENLTESLIKSAIIKMAVEEYKNTSDCQKNINRISDKYGINKKTLARHLKKQNIKIINNGTKSNFNKDAFDVIDTEEKAYWLGFLYADGYISAKGYSVGLNISLKDIEHLKKYNKFLNYNKGLNISETHLFGSKEKFNKNGESMYMVSTVIQNELLWKALNNKGCIPNKSLILTFPDESIFKSKELIFHFIRGYVDGDGTLGVYPHSKQNRNKRLEASLLIVGTKSFLERILNYIGKGFLMHKSNCNGKTYRLGYHCNSAIKCADLLYSNATIYLDRKYDIYINKFAALKSRKNGES